MEEEVITMQDVFRFIRSGLDQQARWSGVSRPPADVHASWIDLTISGSRCRRRSLPCFTRRRVRST